MPPFDLQKTRISKSFWALPGEAHDQIVDCFYSDPIQEIAFVTWGYVLRNDCE